MKIIFVIALFNTGMSYSQSVYWRQIIGEQFDEIGYNCFELRDKGYLMVGIKQIRQIGTSFLTLQTYLVKLDHFGNIIWQRTIGDSINANTAVTAAEDNYGNIYLPYRTGFGHILKMNSNGTILWDKDFSSYNIEVFRGITFVNNSKNLVLLSQNVVQGISTSSITKTDTSGNLIWNKSYYDSIPSISGYSSPNNGYCFSNDQYLISGSKGINGFIIKCDTSGNIIWNKRFIQMKGVFSIVKNSFDSFVTCGLARNGGTYFLKINSEGDSLFGRNFTDDTLYRGLGYEKIVKTIDGNFALGTACGYNESRLGVLDSVGNLIDNFYYIYPDNVKVCQWNINETSDSGFIFTGYHAILVRSFYTDALIFKTDKKGITVLINNIENEISEYSLLNTYPNPFNLSFKLSLKISNTSNVRLDLFDVRGKRLKIIENAKLGSGNYQYYIDLPEFTSGLYFILANVNNKVYSKKILLIK